LNIIAVRSPLEHSFPLLFTTWKKLILSLFGSLIDTISLVGSQLEHSFAVLYRLNIHFAVHHQLN
jgi:hypothetical protein